MNWINTEVVFDFPVPKGVQRVIEDVEQADRQKNFGLYLNLVDYLDVACKNACAARKLTEEQWDQILRKYNTEKCFE